MCVEKEIDDMFVKMSKGFVGHQKEYIPWKKKIENYSGDKKKIYEEKLRSFIPKIDFHN